MQTVGQAMTPCRLKEPVSGHRSIINKVEAGEDETSQKIWRTEGDNGAAKPGHHQHLLISIRQDKSIGFKLQKKTEFSNIRVMLHL